MPDDPANDPGVKGDPVDNQDVKEDPVITDVKGDSQGKSASQRIQELNQKNKDLQAKVDAIEAKEKEREEAEAKKRGDHEKIIEAKEAEIAALKPDAELYREYNQARRETLKSELPEEFHPQIESIQSLVEMEQFATNIKSLKNKDAVPAAGHPGGPPPGEPLKPISKMTPKERRETHEQRLAQYAKS